MGVDKKERKKEKKKRKRKEGGINQLIDRWILKNTNSSVISLWLPPSSLVLNLQAEPLFCLSLPYPKHGRFM